MAWFLGWGLSGLCGETLLSVSGINPQTVLFDLGSGVTDSLASADLGAMLVAGIAIFFGIGLVIGMLTAMPARAIALSHAPADRPMMRLPGNRMLLALVATCVCIQVATISIVYLLNLYG